MDRLIEDIMEFMAEVFINFLKILGGACAAFVGMALATGFVIGLCELDISLIIATGLGLMLYAAIVYTVLERTI